MERIRKQKMKRGIVLFAFNSTKFNYYKMAEYAGNRIQHFLNLPVTLITNEESLPKYKKYNFDNVITIDPDKNNRRDWGIWINKDRYKVFELSPYDETLLLDVDYMVNSNKLLKIFDFYQDFMCHNKTSFLMQPDLPQEILSAYSHQTLWATVVAFKKTKRTKQIFECLEMIQRNFDHYANIHHFLSATYRNDYGLTLALNIANGHLQQKTDFIPWNLLHVGKKTPIYKNNPDPLDTEFTILCDYWQRNKVRKDYITIKNLDFHVMDKENFMSMIDG